MQNVRKPNWPTPAYAMKVLGAYALVALAAGVVAMAILAIVAMAIAKPILLPVLMIGYAAGSAAPFIRRSVSRLVQGLAVRLRYLPGHAAH